MKQKVSLPIIIGGVVALVLVMFGIYKLSFGKGGVEAKAADAPAYAKQMMDQQKAGTAGQPVTSGPASSYGQAYAESGKHRNPYASSGSGSAPQMGGGGGGSMGGMSGHYGNSGGSGNPYTSGGGTR